jgi:Uma2 family endonuclease
MAQQHHAVPIYAFAEQFPLRFRPAVRLSDDAFFELCARNRQLRIERTPEGDIVVMPPTGGNTGRRNAALTAALHDWAVQDGTGLTFDSNTGFLLPNGAERAPDASWVSRVRWEALTPQQRETFPPLCPDFVVELRSSSDRLGELHDKMGEYVANGARLGWLLDPESRRVWVYAPDRPPCCLDDPKAVAGDPVLPRLIIELSTIW